MTRTGSFGSALVFRTLDDKDYCPLVGHVCCPYKPKNL